MENYSTRNTSVEGSRELKKQHKIMLGTERHEQT